MKVIVKRVDEKPVFEEIENKIEALQKIVGGYVEAVGVGNNCIMLVNEEGKLNGLPYNFDMGTDKIVGNAIFIENGGDGDFTDLSEDNINTVLKYFDKTPYTT